MSRSTTTSDNLPPTARSIALLLASTPTVQDAQPGVLHQLLEFSHRYTTQVLSDALVYAEHAGRGGKIEMEDVVLAVQARVGWEFAGRVPKEVSCCSPLLSLLWPNIDFLFLNPCCWIMHISRCSTPFRSQRKSTLSRSPPSQRYSASACPPPPTASRPSISTSSRTSLRPA